MYKLISEGGRLLGNRLYLRVGVRLDYLRYVFEYSVPRSNYWAVFMGLWKIRRILCDTIISII